MIWWLTAPPLVFAVQYPDAKIPSIHPPPRQSDIACRASATHTPVPARRHPFSPQPKSLVKALVKVNRKVLIVSGILAMGQQLVMLSIPLIVQQLLQWLISDDGETYVGILWAFAL